MLSAKISRCRSHWEFSDTPYVDVYCRYGTLNGYDLENLERLYLYQIAACDYYGQYYASTASNRHIYLRQAQHATRLLQAAF